MINKYQLLDHCQEEVRHLGNVGADYLSRRLLHTSLPVGARWNHIRHIAARLALEDEAAQEERYASYIDLLCHQVARNFGFSMAAACMQTTDRTDTFGGKRCCCDYDLMTAAVYTNKLSLLDELSSRKSRCRHRQGSFGNPYEMAALAGHHEALDLLYSKISQYEIDNHNSNMFTRVCAEGSIGMVRKVVPAHWTKEFLEVEDRYNMGKVEGALLTPSIETFQFIMRIKESTIFPTVPERRLGNLLRVAAKNGWLEMTQHLLSLGAPCDSRFEPLWAASLRGHYKVVEALLDHGAKLTDDELGIAAKKGKWDIVRLMVERGADLNSGNLTPLTAAVEFERADVIKDLIELGARVDGEFGQKAVKRARNLGLESMLGLLKEIGANDI